jgi:hypothetical protein
VATGNQSNAVNYAGGSLQTLRDFQLTRATIAEKSSEDWGKKMGATIIAMSDAGISNSYYWNRNTKFKNNRDSANGTYNMAKFMDLLGFNGKQNYANLNWLPFNIVNTIISRLVGRWMLRKEKIVVTAIDPLSVKDKIDQYEEAEFILSNKEALLQLQQESGVQLIPQDQFVAEDKDDLDLWVAEYQRLPEEILNEKGCNEVLASNGWFDVLKEKMLHDSAEVGLVGTYAEMNEQGVINVEWVKPENMIYTYSEFPDFRDTTLRGRVRAMKISELRRKYGKEFGGKLSEREIWDIAILAKDYQLYDKLRWVNEFVAATLRPYDEWNVDVIEWEWRSVDSEGYTVTETKQNKSTLIKKGKPDKLADNQKYEEDSRQNIYRGVIVRNPQILLEWGLKTNMIRPQDPREVGNAEFSYSYYMYQNRDMYNIAIPQKVQEPVEQMILARLKIQQIVAKMVPPGYAINEDAMQAIDYGLGDKNHTIDHQKLFEQTGRLYYKGRDAEGNPIPIPITELQNAGFLPAMQGLIQDYEYHYKVLKDELGEDPALITQATQPRVTGSNVEAAMSEGAAATDYIYNGYKECMKMTAVKVSCLLKDSVQYGSKVYRNILKEEDVIGRQFSSRIEMLPTQQEVQKLEAMVNQAMMANPSFILYCDPFKVVRMAQENYKLADLYFRRAQRRMIEGESKKAAENAKMNADAQNQSLKTKGQMDMQLKQTEAQVEMEKQKMMGDAQSKNTVLAGFMKMVSEGLEIPAYLKPLAVATFESVALPAMVSNQQERDRIQQQMQQQLMMQQQAEQEQVQPEEASPENQMEQQNLQVA